MEVINGITDFMLQTLLLIKHFGTIKQVEKKKNNYTIVLERNGKQKTLYAQIDKKGVEQALVRQTKITKL